MRTNDNYVPTDHQIKHVREVLKMLEAVTKDKRFTEHVDELEKNREGMTMCKVLDEIEEKGRNEGRIEGVQVINYLWEHDRGEDAKRAASDKDFLDQLIMEVGAEICK